MGSSASVHESSVRVRYGEVDRMGVVYHGHYLAWFDQGRTEFFRSLGSSYRDLEDSGTLLVVVETSLQFLKPAAYDDLLTVRTRLVLARGVRLRFEYEVVRDGEVLATGHTVLASTDRTGRPRRPPASLSDRLGDVAEQAPAGKSRGLRAVQDGRQLRQ